MYERSFSCTLFRDSMRRFTSLAPRSGMVKRYFTSRQREGHEEILRAIAALGDETKRDIAALGDETKRDIAALRDDVTSLQEEMASVRVGKKKIPPKGG